MCTFQDNQDKIWDHYQNEGSFTFKIEVYGRFRYILRHISKDSKVLNIGVGGGQFEELAAKSHDIYCLDPNERAISNLRSRLNIDETKAKTGYSTAIPYPDNYFDCVVMSEVLEHLSDEIIQSTLLEIKRVLKSDGAFIGTVPASENLEDNRVYCPKCETSFHIWGHCQSFDRSRLHSVLATCFSVKKLVDSPLINFRDRRFKGKVTGLFRLILYKLNLFKTCGSLFFVAKKN